MSQLYVDGSIHAFLDKLAGSSPEPGGGSVAALVGALGAGLVSMVASLTIGKEKYASVAGSDPGAARRVGVGARVVAAACCSSTPRSTARCRWR